MEQFLDQAEILLRGVVQSHDISTLVILHRLRDLAGVLDNLKLYDECRMTGDCALDLAEALGRRSLEFRHEQAETLSLIAGFSVYQPRARTLFIQAVSICEEVVANNASHSSKCSILFVLCRATYMASAQDRVQWLGFAVQLMTKGLPPTMVDPRLHSTIYNNYGTGLHELKQYANALEAYDEAISHYRGWVINNPVKYNYNLVEALTNVGVTLSMLGKYGDAIRAYRDALELCRAMLAQGALQYNDLMAKTLYRYTASLVELNRYSEAAEMGKVAISLCRIAQAGERVTSSLCSALHNYGLACYLLGQHAEAVLAFQESIPLRRARAATDPTKEKYLGTALHNIANSFHALNKHSEANAAATEALEGNHGRVLEACHFASDFRSCFVCQGATKSDSTTPQ